MKNFATQLSRRRKSGRFQTKVSLSELRLQLLVKSTLTLATCLPAFCVQSCHKIHPLQSEPGQEQADSAWYTIGIDAGGVPVRRLDILVYGSSGTGQLEDLHTINEAAGEVQLRLREGSKRILAIANSPYNLNRASLARYDNALQIAYSFNDDDPLWPVMGGIAETDPEGKARAVLRPLLCKVRIARVFNDLDGYELLESPRVRLNGINASAKIFDTEGFSPSETISEGRWTDLPCDIGFYPQTPGTVLYCYPNDTPENILGASRTELEFECTIDGEICSYTIPLPPLARNSTTDVDFGIDAGRRLLIISPK